MLRLEKLPDNPEQYSLSVQLNFTHPLVKARQLQKEVSSRVRQAISELVSGVISARRDPSLLSNDERSLVNPYRLMPFRKKKTVVEQVADKSHQIVVGTDGKNPPKAKEDKPRPPLPGTYERVHAAIQEQRIIDKAYLDELREFEEKAEAGLVIEEPRGRERFSRGLIIAGSTVLAASLVALAFVVGGECNKQSVSVATVPAASSPKPPKPEDVVKPTAEITLPQDTKPQESLPAVQLPAQQQEVSPAPELEAEPDIKPVAGHDEEDFEKIVSSETEVKPEVLPDPRQVVIDQVLDEINPGFPVSSQIGEIVGLYNNKKVWEDNPILYSDLLKAVWGKYKEKFVESAEYLSKYGETEMQRKNAAKAWIAIKKLESSNLDEMPAWIATPTLHDAMRFWKLPESESTQQIIELPLAA